MSTTVLKAICNPKRLKIIKCLEKSDKTVSQLVTVCGISQSAVSQHLKKLKAAGVVRDRKVSRQILYSLRDTGYADIANELLKLPKEELI